MSYSLLSPADWAIEPWALRIHPKQGQGRCWGVGGGASGPQSSPEAPSTTTIRTKADDRNHTRQSRGRVQCDRGKRELLRTETAGQFSRGGSELEPDDREPRPPFSPRGPCAPRPEQSLTHRFSAPQARPTLTGSPHRVPSQRPSRPARPPPRPRLQARGAQALAGSSRADHPGEGKAQRRRGHQRAKDARKILLSAP